MLNNTILDYVGFALTLGTFVAAFFITKKLNKMADKNQFLRERHEYEKKLIESKKNIALAIDLKNVIPILRDIGSCITSVADFDIWKDVHKEDFDNFKRYNTTVLEQITKQVAGITVSSSSAAEYYEIHLESFKNDYDSQISKIISIIHRDATVR